MDKVGDSMRLVSEHQHQLPLILTVRALNPLHKEVSLRGQIQVANLLEEGLEIKLLPKADGGAAHVSEMRGLVAPSALVTTSINLIFF